MKNKKGLYNRYIVSKANGKPIDPEAKYFVMRYDADGKDAIHTRACRKAIMVYAMAISAHLPELSIDLHKVVSEEANRAFRMDLEKEEQKLKDDET